MANLIFSILSTFNDKGLKKASKQVSLFEKQTKSLQATFLKTFSALTLLNYSKKAVNAFMADEAAAKSLETQLKNTGYAFSAPSVEYYIANLEKMTGVLDDHLRPAFQTLLTASGSLTRSQNALAVALDVSAATGKSVEEVSQAMAKGFSGQTTALSRLGAGLSKATLATGNMDLIMAELQDKFSGQARARLETYAGKMDLLRVSTARATEIIGKGLLDALSAIGKDQSLEKFGKDLEDTATSISYLVSGVAQLVAEINKLANIRVGGGSVLDLILRNLPVISAYYNAGKSAAAAANAPKSNFEYSLGTGAASELARIQELKARKALVVQLKAEEALKKLKDKYDVERIGLMAALNFATDEETKLKIAEKLAILDGNAAKAAEYLATRNAEQSLEEFAKKADDAGTILVDGALEAYKRLAIYDPVRNMAPGQGGYGGGGGGGGGGGITTNVPNGNNSLFTQPSDTKGSNYLPVEVTLELAPNAGEFGQLIYNSFLINQRNGLAQNYAGGNF